LHIFRTSIVLLFLGQILSVFSLYSQNIKLTNSENIWSINDSSYLFRSDTLNELWLKDKSLEIWKLNESTEIFTFCDSQLRLWRKGNNLNLWSFDKNIDDWKAISEFQTEKHKLNDSISYSVINDTIKWVEIHSKSFIFKTLKNIYVWNKKNAEKQDIINDTINLYRIDDTSRLWVYKDQSFIWKLRTFSKKWKVSSTTIVWTIDKLTELWKAGNKYNIWNFNTENKKWEQNPKILPKKLDSLYNYWYINPAVIVLTSFDSIQIWQSQAKDKIWKLNDTLKIWKLAPVKKIEESKDTIIPEKIVQTARLWNKGKSFILWDINDSIKLFRTENSTELWNLNKSVKLWKISDSTLIWNIGKETKISMISDTMSVWVIKDKEFDWKVDSLRKPKWLEQDFLILEVNDSCRFTNIKDTISIWNSYGSARIVNKRDLNCLNLLKDSVEFWQANDSVKIWIGKYDEEGKVWERNKRVNILNINDSTKIWQLNENVRLSIIDGKMKIWRQGIDDPNISWRETKEFKHDKINDSTKIWYINQNTIIWETKHKIEVWNLNQHRETYRLSDTSIVYTYNTAQASQKLPKPKFWTYIGTSKMDLAQVYIDKWANGGENSITTLFIVNFQANYSKKKIKWDNDFEYRYGFLRNGNKPLRKNEDKIKINSIFNYYAFKKWYYGFTVTGLTQFFKGYKYESDTIKYIVSDFMSPFYFTAALGMNYFPIKQLSVFFSPLTHKTIFIRDTTEVNPVAYGVSADKKVRNEPGLIIKSVLNWNITKSINILSKLDLFTRYNDIKKYNVDWESTITFKFTNIIQATLNTHFIYDPDVLIKQSDGSEKNSPQFKEVFSIGLFYKI
jgi:hypothetical protein